MVVWCGCRSGAYAIGKHALVSDSDVVAEHHLLAEHASAKHTAFAESSACAQVTAVREHARGAQRRVRTDRHSSPDAALIAEGHASREHHVLRHTTATAECRVQSAIESHSFLD